MGAEQERTTRGRRFAWATAGAAVVLAVVAGGGSAASAAAHAPAAPSHARSGGAAGGGHHGPLPVIGNATDLSREPVVHATKGRPPTRLEVKDLVVGKGAAVTSGSTVSVLYVGADYATGKDFTQASWTTRSPITFSLRKVVRGFAEGLIGMKVGGRREIVIPPSLGYGDEAEGPIKADETLVFVVDLKGVTS